MVHMPARPPKARSTHRFSVTLSAKDFRRLKRMADEQDPPLSLRYVVELAVKRFLKRPGDQSLVMKFGGTARDGNGHE
jgi:hypothetical protein